ncbi:MAG: response regulator [Candidatus Delongbacteria bacterium]|nr:response regulator [Candidatus Delongbacteria bacterium]MBN2834063.1 response regulator [Candidatus Delongbacteria bacterium]
MTRILLAEDDIEIGKVLIDNLEDQGYTVDYSPDGLDALKKIENIKYDLLITDVKMPKMDGLELLENVRKGKLTSTIPVLIISGYLSLKEVKKILENGKTLFLPKPIQFNDLNQNINMLLEP